MNNETKTTLWAAIQAVKRLSKLTGESYSVFKTLSGYDVVPESALHTAMGVCVYESTAGYCRAQDDDIARDGTPPPEMVPVQRVLTRRAARCPSKIVIPFIREIG